MDSQRVGHHWIPRAVIVRLHQEGLIDEKARELFERFTEIPEHMNHRFDSWFVDGQKVTHAAYNQAMEELMRGIAKSNLDKGVLTSNMAEELIKAFESGDFSKYTFAGEQLKLIRRWCRGFLESQGWAEALLAISRERGIALSPEELKRGVRLMTGDRTVHQSKAIKALMKALQDKATHDSAVDLAVKSASFGRAARFAGFVSWALLAKDAYAGATGQGKNPDRTGVAGAIDNTAYNAMMAAELEESFRTMANGAAQVSGAFGVSPIDRKRIQMGLPVLGAEGLGGPR
jgi:hypothetical protein